MRSATLLFLASLSTAFAYQVTRPSTTHGWTNVGPQTVQWDRVDTDATNFSLVLTNQNRDLLEEDIVIAPLVDAIASDGTTSVSPPSGGWPSPGSGYRVNMVRSGNHVSTIYAQSNEFNITAAPASTSSTQSNTTPAGAGTAAGTTSGSTTGTAGTTGGSAAGSPAGQGASTTGGNSDVEADSDSMVAPDLGNGASDFSVSISAGLFTSVMALIIPSLL